MNRRAGLCVLLLLGLTGLARAAEPSHIEAEQMEWREAEGRILFSGKVHYRYPAQAIEIHAEELAITQQQKKLDSVQANGEPVTFSQHPPGGKQIQGEANELYYDARSETVRLSGEAYLQADGDTLRGETILYDLRSQQAEVSGDQQQGGRFEAIIQTPGKQDDVQQ